MIVESVKLENFRNYQSLQLRFDRKTNLFFGDNAQGKTNILEAIYLCGTTKSHRTGKDRDMILFGQEESHIRMNLRQETIPVRIDMHLKKNRPKGIAINGIPIRRAGELLGIANFVFFSPEDLNIIKNGPAERRRFLDMELCQLSKVYLSYLSNYNKAVNQRNKLLKELSFRPDFMDVLDVWDVQMLTYGEKIISERDRFIKKLNDVIKEVHQRLTGKRENLCLEYEKNVSAEEFEETLKKNRERDIKMKMSMTGPHRDDIRFQTDHLDIRKFGSQGQQRTAALSLKLSEIEMIKEETKDTPILLLDDVLSELDGNRQKYLLDSIHGIQTFITCTGLDGFIQNQFQVNKVFHVINGTVTEKS